MEIILNDNWKLGLEICLILNIFIAGLFCHRYTEDKANVFQVLGVILVSLLIGVLIIIIGFFTKNWFLEYVRDYINLKIGNWDNAQPYKLDDLEYYLLSDKYWERKSKFRRRFKTYLIHKIYERNNRKP